MNIDILYQDESTVVINKPVDVVVNRANTVGNETIQDWVEEQDWWKEYGDELFSGRSGVCHRLDKETSGCLLIAKNPEALSHYLKLFKDRKVQKTYRAMVHGRVEPKEGTIILPMRRKPFDRQKWQVRYDGKRAETSWKVEQYIEWEQTQPRWKDTLTWLSVFPKTGRTHQIRVHLSFLRWPIFADDKYLNEKQARNDRRYMRHHFLHAAVLEIEAFSGKQLKIEAPLPEDCQSFLTEFC